MAKLDRLDRIEHNIELNSLTVNRLGVKVAGFELAMPDVHGEITALQERVAKLERQVRQFANSNLTDIALTSRQQQIDRLERYVFGHLPDAPARVGTTRTFGTWIYTAWRCGCENGMQSWTENTEECLDCHTLRPPLPEADERLSAGTER